MVSKGSGGHRLLHSAAHSLCWEIMKSLIHLLGSDFGLHTILHRNIKHNDSSVNFLTPASEVKGNPGTIPT